jgi:glutathione S-transferase
MNPNSVVPTLVEGDFSLWESNVVVRYLCAKHSMGKLYPEDLQERFNAERWMDWQQTTFNPASRQGFWQLIRTAPEQRNAQAISDSNAAVEALLATLDTVATSAFVAWNLRDALVRGRMMILAMADTCFTNGPLSLDAT